MFLKFQAAITFSFSTSQSEVIKYKLYKDKFKYESIKKIVSVYINLKEIYDT